MRVFGGKVGSRVFGQFRTVREVEFLFLIKYSVDYTLLEMLLETLQNIKVQTQRKDDG